MGRARAVVRAAFLSAAAGALLLAASPSEGARLVDVRPLTESVVVLEIVDGEVLPETLGNGADGRVLSEPLDLRRAALRVSYRLVSAAEPAFLEGVSPLRVGRKSKGTDFTRVAEWRLGSVSTHWIYLELDRPLRRGGRYFVDVRFPLQHGARSDFVFDERSVGSEAIQVNQIGFTPDARPKLARVSHWMGSLGPLELPGLTERSFELLCAETGDVVFKGQPSLRRRRGGPDDAYGYDHVGADLWELDFSEWRRPGTYRVVLEGVGASLPFRIGEDVHEVAYRTAMSGLLHQRCGIALGPPLTEWRRPRCHHPADRRILRSRHPRLVKANAFAELPAAATDQEVNCAGGWHDAGDWDRGDHHLAVSDMLLLVHELLPGAFVDGELRVPESGNGLPDLLDEARWGVDLFLCLQAADGGVGGGLESSGHPALGAASWTDELPLFAYASDPAASLRFAASAAKLARALEREARPEEAAAYAESATRAWGWALEQGGDAPPLRDLRAHAAVELWRATGSAPALEAFSRDFLIDSPGRPLATWAEHDQRWAAWTWVLATPSPETVDRHRAARLACIAFAESEIHAPASKRARRHGYSWHKPPGHTGFTTPRNLELMVAHALTSDERHLEQMQLNVDVTLGANSLNTTWITGLGSRPVAALLHHDSWFDGKAEPVPGLVPYGPLRYKEEGKGLNWTHAWGQRTAFPAASAWPAEELWFGNRMSPAQAEFTVTETVGPTAAAFAWLAGFERLRGRASSSEADAREPSPAPP